MYILRVFFPPLGQKTDILCVLSIGKMDKHLHLLANFVISLFIKYFLKFQINNNTYAVIYAGYYHCIFFLDFVCLTKA